MALGVLNGRFQFQRATKKEWEDSNIVLLDGELALESDTTKMKAGDGKTIYADLPYISIGDFSFADLTEEEKARVKGAKGDAFTYDDFTQKQLDELKGEKGDIGPRGPQGIQGKTGEKGDVGPQGPKGQDGVVTFESLSQEQKDSLKGEKGDQGEKGERGPIGPAGPAGADGKQGPQGEKGDKGVQGIQGKTGATGVKGDKGDPGKGIVDSRTGVEIKIWSGTQSEYDAIETKDANTLYLIKE